MIPDQMEMLSDRRLWIRPDKIYDFAVVGAGASGLLAAITAARNGAKPILLEHMEQAAKKLLATGNGKCNYTNKDQNPDFYYCAQPDFLQTVLTQFSYADTVRFFEEIGIRPLQKNGTCIYPENEQAASVRYALLAETQRLRIPLICSIGIRNIRKVSKKLRGKSVQVFEIQTKEGSVYAVSCLLATGGQAAKKTGSDGSGYLYAAQLGHTLIPPLPALTPLLVNYRDWKLPSGVRTACTASLFVDGVCAAQECGELQITDYGISGIVIFQFSRLAARALANDRQVGVRLDFKPEMTRQELSEYLYKRLHSIYHLHKTVSACLKGFLPEKLIPVLVTRAGIKPDLQSVHCTNKQAGQLAYQFKNTMLTIIGMKNFDSAQVTAGGVPLEEIHAQTMESRLVRGLFFAGEIVDVDAKCGGYNLQWAWASGYVAAKHIRKDDA